ncbi:hypothetical protein PAC10_28 [Propionibacterium phage PAC10]|nr:hypothetical protein PAC10_28 [Propionibacterium phage PAC10]
MLADKTIPATQLARMLTEAGYPISATVIKDYRRKQANTTQKKEEENQCTHPQEHHGNKN